ncbi:MAG TPA: zinc-ribbon domain-containing protein, partial [Pyrinomonadaceae bacterium]|nr:zinc-ribbon domain-containing protein [Pyrinomonadaceae bacterium]
MIIVCQKCSTRLQVDDEKSPHRPFSVRCPKCNSTVNSAPASPATEQGTLAAGGSPATDHPRFEQSTARSYEAATPSSASETVSSDETVRMLFELLSKGTRSDKQDVMVRPSWDKRKAL